MHKAMVTLVSLLGSVGVFVAVESLSSAPTGGAARSPETEVSELPPPPLEPASAIESSDSLVVDPDVIYFEEVRVPRRPKAPATPAAAPKRELRPCSEWEDVGPKSLRAPDGSVEMQRARLLC
jgi:hypothetical protein